MKYESISWKFKLTLTCCSNLNLANITKILVTFNFGFARITSVLNPSITASISLFFFFHSSFLWLGEDWSHWRASSQVLMTCTASFLNVFLRFSLSYMMSIMLKQKSWRSSVTLLNWFCCLLSLGSDIVQ